MKGRGRLRRAAPAPGAGGVGSEGRHLTISIEKCTNGPMPVPVGPRGAPAPEVMLRCPGCRHKLVIRAALGILVRNAILRVERPGGRASAKCPRCKAWVEVPLRFEA